MKRLLKIILIAGVALAIMAFGARASSDGCIEYIITAEGNDYLLSCYIDGAPTPILRSSDFSDLTEYLSSMTEASVVFGGISVNDNLNILKGSYFLSGSLTLSEGATMNIDANDVIMSGMTLKTEGGSIRVKRGALTVENSSISSNGGAAIVLDYSAEASFCLKSGSISSEADTAALRIDFGSALILGGEIKNTVGACIENKSTLILAGTPQILGEGYDIISSSPISLSNKSAFFSGSVSVRYEDNFEEGTVSCVFYSASESSLRKIKFYDATGEEKKLTFFESFNGFSEKNFGAVYLPYYVNFYIDSSLVKREEVLRGNTVEMQSAQQKEGYEFIGWSTENGSDSLYDFARNVNNSFNLYAKYRLKPPSFSISSLNFDYDGRERKLGVNSLSHPLLNFAIVNYTWYRDGKVISNSGAEISVKTVSDSGSYSCKILFTYGTDSVTVTTPSVTVSISKATVSIPKIESRYYNAEFQKPSLYSCSVYTVSDSGGTVVGDYPVKISLNDTENYVFDDGSSVVLVDFKIIKADNYWIDDPIIYDVYEGVSPSPFSASRFGEAVYLYSDKADGVYTDSIPKSSGSYYCIAKVSSTDNYHELISEPMSFSVIEEKLTGISILSMPNRCNYEAFQKFVADGLMLSVTYNSSRIEEIGAEKISINYQSGDSFRYNDTAVIASYLDRSIAVPVNVEKAEYDISNIGFTDSVAVFDGMRKSIDYKGILPIGLDGIELKCSVIGGGINAGIYSVVLVFETESKNYKTPASIEAILTVSPYETEAVFTESSFVYDGSLKCPTAYYMDIYGRKINLEVSGARSLAGDYTAVASCSDLNYILIDSSIVYTIEKATYDFKNVIWSGESFVYDGSYKSVTVSGLPSGVSVIGYSDNAAVNAGEYTARAALLYDERNYNPPPELMFKWIINKAEYDISSFGFSDKLSVFSGEAQYPDFFGSMPSGADGILLEYKFDRGVVNVSEGRVSVNIVFSTSSKNYNVPENMTAFVEILPFGISVNWSNFEFVYDTSAHAPSASATECGISVLGAKTDAGTYTATAITLDSNYYVINPKVEFVINRAVNFWTQTITMNDIFEGMRPSPYAVCLAGDVSYVYFSDSEGKNIIDTPNLPGIYYVRAITNGNVNYSSLKSNIISFEVKKIIPVGISVSLNRNDFSAFDSVTCGDLTVIVENNDGSFITIDAQKTSVRYQTSESLRYGDRYITVSYLEFTQNVAVSVSKADYDMSRVKWSEGDFIYDGREKIIFLEGLPSGVSVISYSGASGTLVGEYYASAELAFDSYNYNKPIVPDGVLKIKRQVVIPPSINSLVYNGSEQTPEILESELYTAEYTPSVFAGSYPVLLKLSDSKNFEFSNSLSEITVYYDILPMQLTIKISDIDKYIGDKMPIPSYTITEGKVADQDSLELSFTYDKDSVSCEASNKNYLVTVIPGKIIRHNFLSDDDLFRTFVIFLLVLAIVFLVLIFIMRRNDIIHYVSVMKCRLSPVSKSANSVRDIPNDSQNIPEDKSGKEELEEITEAKNVLSVDANHADSLITDSLAKNLVRKADTKVYTDGTKKRIINVDTLSENFSSGECVDVNKLKQMSLVPYDTAYIKILARGIIDKPLKVYANDFSLSAVKMIALTGGEAIRVVTVRKKNGINYGSDDKFISNS